MIIYNPYNPYNLFSLPYFIWEFLKKVIFGGKTTTVKGNTMGVLGMPEAGKTQFYKTLKGEKYSEYEATSTEDYPEFDFKINGRIIKIKPGRDIGGSERYIQVYYENFINQKDIIVFIFDVKKYLESKVYQRDVRDRLEYIWRKLREKSGVASSIPMTISYVKTKFILFASHSDQLTDIQMKSAIADLHESVNGKIYCDMFHNNMYMVDLRDRNFLFEIFNKTELFG